MELFNSLKKSKVLVVGGTKGIGKTAATYLAKLGAELVIVARNNDNLRNTVDQLKMDNTNVHGITGDISSINDITNVVKQTKEILGTIDILINCAGVNIPKPALEVTEEDWDRVHDINL